MELQEERTYIAIDLKSFYASVECAERGLDPLTTNLVVADTSRTEKTICLAVSPSLKSYGIGGRARLFEVVQRIRQINNERRQQCGGKFSGKSYHNPDLKKHSDWELDFIAAKPRMARYIEVSAQIYGIYLKYIAAEDIHVYSIDEVFMDVTPYLKHLGMTPHELAMTIIHDVLHTTGITATAGIGTNMYLCKVAMDIVAKHIPADKDGVRIAELNEMSYRKKLWSHQPLTDFWRVGRRIAKRLEEHGLYTMGDIALQSERNEELLYKLFGVNAELLIDHAWGWEPCTMEAIKTYKPTAKSLSQGQVLQCPYNYKKALVVMKEMAEALALDLVDKRLTTNQIAIYIGYDAESLTSYEARFTPIRDCAMNYYGKIVPKPAKGMMHLQRYTSSARIITKAATTIFEDNVDPDLLIRRINITAANIIPEDASCNNCIPQQLDLFTDYDALQRKTEEEDRQLAKERRMQEAVLKIKKSFGKNTILKALDFEEGATARERNQQIGGHHE